MAMDKQFENQELFEYYNERASEYEEFYWGGSGARFHDPELYTRETLTIRGLLPDLVSGKCLDIACGTGFWLPVYEKNCTSIILIDQSKNVLAECKRKVNLLGIHNKTEIIRANILEYDFPKKTYDSIVTGFLISHLSDLELNKFFHLVKDILVSGGRVSIIDNTWNEDTADSGRTKTGTITRKLNDDREFKVYKRYFEQDDIIRISEEHKFIAEFIFWGKVFFLVSIRFRQI